MEIDPCLDNKTLCLIERHIIVQNSLYIYKFGYKFESLRKL